MKANGASQGDPLTPVQKVSITPASAGMRLDRFISQQLSGLPISRIQKLLRTGQVRVNSRRAKGADRLLVGDEVRLPPVRLEKTAPASVALPPRGFIQSIGGRILLKTDSFLVFNKPAGLPVHGGSGQPWGIIDGLRHYFEADGRVGQPELCHRLDRDTSGCLLLALTPSANRQLSADFRGNAVQKEYLALVQGLPTPAQGVIEHNLVKGVVRAGERMVVVSAGGAVARTHYTVVSRFDGAATVAITLETGRTHQIRAHFRALGHPVAGDFKYGDRDFNRLMRAKGLKRMFLHASRLRFPHPEEKNIVQVVAPLDEELQRILAKLEQE